MKGTTVALVGAGVVAGGLAIAYVIDHRHSATALLPTGNAGDVWVVSMTPTQMLRINPLSLGEILSTRRGTENEGGVDTTVFTIRLARQTAFFAPQDFKVARPATASERATFGVSGEQAVWP